MRLIFILSSGDASDSICPKGWGMAEWDGDGSYQRLIKSVYGMNKTEIILAQSYNEYNNVRVDEIATQLSLSLIRTGTYNYNNGTFYKDRNGIGEIQGKRVRWNILKSCSSIYDNGIHNHNSGDRGHGYSVRCVAKSFFLKKISPLFSSQSFLLPVIFTTRFVRKVSNRDA